MVQCHGHVLKWVETNMEKSPWNLMLEQWHAVG